jgi:hypothetical protein
VANLMAAINAAHAGNTLDVSAALNGGSTGNLVLTGTSGIASITVGGTATADSAIGFGAGANSFQPVNLLTQGAVAPGDTLTVNVNGTPTTITFGTGSGQVATLAQLQSAIGAISGVTATVNTANGKHLAHIEQQYCSQQQSAGAAGGFRHQQDRRISFQRHRYCQRRLDLHRPVDRWRLHHRL